MKAPLSTISSIEPSRHAPGTAYLAVDAHQIGVIEPGRWFDAVAIRLPDTALADDDWSSRFERVVRLATAADAIELRIHSLGSWEVAAAGRSLAAAAAAVFGLHVKAFPARIRERRGQPTTYSAVLSSEPLKLNHELQRLDIGIGPVSRRPRPTGPLRRDVVDQRRGGVAPHLDLFVGRLVDPGAT